MLCQNCGTQNRVGAKFCAGCGTLLAASVPAVVPQYMPPVDMPMANAPMANAYSFAKPNALTFAERKEILDREVDKYLRQGWQLMSRTDTSAQLLYETKASCLVALVLALLLIVPALLYLMFYKGSRKLFLEVDEQGAVKATPS